MVMVIMVTKMTVNKMKARTMMTTMTMMMIMMMMMLDASDNGDDVGDDDEDSDYNYDVSDDGYDVMVTMFSVMGPKMMAVVSKRQPRNINLGIRTKLTNHPSINARWLRWCCCPRSVYRSWRP